MNEIKVRFAQISDLEAIREIWNYYIANTTVNFDYIPKEKDEVLDWFKNKQEMNYPVLVCEKDNQIMGYASFGSFRSWQGYLFSVEHGIYIKPGMGGNGYGKLLFTRLLEEAKNQQKHSMIGAISSDNIESLDFHKKMGFREVAHLKEIGYKFDKWLDCTFVQLIIS